ncbi:MAG: replicative DNA helicase [Candidatus Chisholmbacteria bacterium]|nr:replicative DNA helicase [Candidatus Chisholmbacteria bacterium]
MAEPKLPPQSLEAEQSVLGALLLDKDAIVQVADFLLPDHFYKDNHAKIFEVMLNLYEEREPIDLVTVTEKLKNKRQLTKVGGAAYLTTLVNKVPTAAHVEQYGRIVKDHYIKREIIRVGGELAEMGFDEAVAVGGLMDRAEQMIFGVSQRHLRQTFMAVRQALTESFDRLDQLHKSATGLRGVPTGFADLDDALAGMQPSNLLVLAARPGIGKTSLALNIAQFVAVEAKLPVGFFSLEMSREELLDRLLVAQADIDAWKLKTGKLDEEDFTKLSDAMGVLAEAPLFIDDTPGTSVLEMRTKARRLMAEQDLKLLVVDYLQLVRGRGLENRVQEVTEISQGLKNLARELKVPVLAVSQLSRAVEHRGTKQPQLADLRESGCLLGDSLLTLADTGKQVTIESVVGKRNIKVLAMDKQMKLVPAVVSKVFSSGKKVVYRLRLKSGKVIGATVNHRFFTVGGFKRLDQLQVGDRLATPRVLPITANQNETLNDDRLIVLAHMIGDGCYVRRQPLHYTNSDLALVHAVETAAVNEFAVQPRLVPQQNWYHLYLASEEHLARGRRNPIVKWFDEELGIYGQSSRQKFIPEVVFRQPQERLTLFLRHLWSTDGCVHVNKKAKGPLVRIYYASGSELLVRQVSHLLLRLGIISRVGHTGKVGYEDVWAVHIQGKTDQLRFLELVGGVGDKLKVVEQAIKVLRKVEANPNNDVIPKDIWEDIEILRREVGLTTREFHAQLGWAYSGTQRHNNGLSRNRLKRVLQVVSNYKLAALVNSDLYWDEVVKITRLGVREVFDATVPVYANFVANDIVVHNSIEQDADVVMF